MTRVHLGDGPTVRIRASKWYLLARVGTPVGLLFLDLVDPGFVPSGWLWRGLYWGFCGIVGLLAFASYWRGGIDLTPTEAVVNNWQRRRIPWAAIINVTEQRDRGERRILLWTTGQSFALRAPTQEIGNLGTPHFEEQFRIVRQWWLDHR